jgi:cell division initiation protein
MKLTPLEIKQHRFDKSLRGYDVNEVHSFLELVASEVDQLQQKNSDLNEQVEKLNKRITHYEKVEEAIHETLQTTKESVAQKMEQVRSEAKTAMDRAHMEAETIIKEAQQQRSLIRQDMIRLLERREEMISSFQQFLENNQTLVEKFAANEFQIFDPIEEPEGSAREKNAAEKSEVSTDTEKDELIETANFEAGSDSTTEVDDVEPKKEKKESSNSMDNDDDFMNSLLDFLD